MPYFTFCNLFGLFFVCLKSCFCVAILFFNVGRSVSFNYWATWSQKLPVLLSFFLSRAIESGLHGTNVSASSRTTRGGLGDAAAAAKVLSEVHREKRGRKLGGSFIYQEAFN